MKVRGRWFGREIGPEHSLSPLSNGGYSTRASDADLTTVDDVLATYAAEREWKPCKDDLRELTSI